MSDSSAVERSQEQHSQHFFPGGPQDRRGPEGWRRVAREHISALLIFLVIALLLLLPLVRNFTTHVTGNAIDDPALAWNLWWVKYSLIDLLNPDIFHVGWMFHPVQINLGFYTLTPLNGLLSIPLQSAFGLVVANNVLLLLSFVLGAYGAMLLARQMLFAPFRRDHVNSARAGFHSTGYWTATLVAGIVFAFAAPKLFYASLGQFNIASTQWIPFCVLYILRLGNGRTTRSALRSGGLAGLFLVLQAWSELTYASFLLLFFGLAALFAMWGAFKGEVQWRALISGWLTSAVVFIAGIAPFLWAMLPDLRSEGDFFSSAGSSASGGGFADLFSADFAGYLVPGIHNPWFGAWASTLPFPNQFGQQIFLGYLTMALALVGLVWLWRVARRTALFWAVASLFFFLLTLGPTARWMGKDTGIPGPFALVSMLPFFSGNRYPSRYGVMLLLCVAMLAAAGVLAVTLWICQRNWKISTRPGAWYAFGMIVVTLLLVDHWSLVTITDFRIPSVYATLAAQPGDLAVLELPTGWRNGARVLGKSDELIMMQQWYQTEHAKRRLGGNTSRNPQHKFQYFTDHPLIGDLIPLMNADQEYLTAAVDAALPEMIARHTPIAAQELADLGVGWVTVAIEKSTPELLDFVDAMPLTLLEEWHGADWNGESSTIRLYSVDAAQAVSERTIDLASDSGMAFTAQGWSPLTDGEMRLALRPTADLVLPVAPGDLLGFSGTGEATIRLNGEALAWTNGESFAIAAPQALTGEPVDRISIAFGGRGTSTFANGEASAIGATGVSLDGGVTLALRSAAEQVGDFAEIWLNGQNVADGARGYNLAALTPAGALLASATFDTFASDEESARMAAWIAALPAGTVVAGAVADEASMHLTQAAVDALASLGVGTDLREHFRWSHAFIGVTGAPANSALEQADVLRPAGVWLGAPLLGPALFGAQSAVTVTTAP